MGTSFVSPGSTPNPMIPQDEFLDQSGNLTHSAWWLIHSMRSGTQVALDGTVATITPAPAGIDNAIQINATIQAVIAVGGGALQLIAGEYPVQSSIVFPFGTNRISIIGNGSTIFRAANMPVNQGVFDFQACQLVSIQDLVIEGNVSSPARINYSTFAGDPMFAQFVLNTSIWIHAGSTDISFDGVTISHTGGYAAISDTRVGPNNKRIKFTRCNFFNNRPFLFGTNNVDLNYGSWPGGIFYKADCSTALNVGVTEDFSVDDCSFERNTGNCIWGHCSGFFNYHRNIRVTNNGFLDCGLDAIQIACTIGGAVIGNVGQRIGYVTTDDVSEAVPRYLPGLNATFLDFSGYVEGVPITGNSCSSICGGFSAPDGFCYAAITGNSFRQPQPGDPLYVDDHIADIPAGVVYGFDFNNSSFQNGGDGISCVGNSLYGCTAGSIIAIAFRNGTIAANDIYQPGNSVFAPIFFGNNGASALQRAYGNSVTGNRIYWSPLIPAAVIIESENWSGTHLPWAPGDTNWIEGNHIFDPLQNAFDFSRAPSSSSTTRRRIPSEAAGLLSVNYGDLYRSSDADGTNGHTIILASNGRRIMRWDDGGNVGVDGAGAPAYKLDIRVGQNVPGIHVCDTDADKGTYIFSSGNSTYVSNGAAWNGAAWIAKDVTACIFLVGSTARVYINTGLTIGAVFVPTQVMHVDSSGNLVVTGNVSGGGTDLAALLASVNALAAGKADHGTYAVVAGNVTI